MSLDPSKYSQNQIESSTRKRFALMDEFISNMKLKSTAATTGIPEFAGVMGSFSMLFGAWHSSYLGWRTATVHIPATTLAFEEKMASLTRATAAANSPLETWDSTIAGQIPTLGPVYLEFFPNGRATFTQGTYETRLDALENLGIALAAQVAKPVLVALGVTVSAFAAEARTLHDAQTQAKAALESSRIVLETRRLAIAIAGYQVIGCGMMVWGATPDLVDTLFDVNILRAPALDAPAAPVDTLWTPATRTLSTTVMPVGATRLEAWRTAPGGMPEQLHTGDAGQTAVVIPATITWVSGGLYQIWLVAVNSTGASDPGPVQSWTAP